MTGGGVDVLSLLGGLGIIAAIVGMVLVFAIARHGHVTAAIIVAGLGFVALAGYWLVLGAFTVQVQTDFHGPPHIIHFDNSLPPGVGNAPHRLEHHGPTSIPSFQRWFVLLPIGGFGIALLMALLLHHHTRAGTVAVCKVLVVVAIACLFFGRFWMGYASTPTAAHNPLPPGQADAPAVLGDEAWLNQPQATPTAAVRSAPVQPPRAQTELSPNDVAEALAADAATANTATNDPPATSPPAEQPIVASAPPPKPAVPKKPRPAWVSTAEGREGNFYRMVVSSGRYTTRLECERRLNAEMARAAQRYIENFLGAPAAEQVAIDPIYLQAHVKQSEFAEVVDTSVGPMHEIHALLGFDQQAQDYFREQWRNVLVADRLQKTAAVALGVLAVIGVAFVWLKLKPGPAAVAGEGTGQAVADEPTAERARRQRRTRGWTLAALFMVSLPFLAYRTSERHERVTATLKVNSRELGAKYDREKRALLTDLRSTSLLKEVVSLPNVSRLELTREQPDPVRWLSQNLRTAYPADAEILTVSLDCSRPDDAAVVLDALVDQLTIRTNGGHGEETSKEPSLTVIDHATLQPHLKLW